MQEIIKPLGIPHKRVRNKTKGSSTPGRSKGENCHATSIQKYVAKRNRSYKLPEYTSVLQSWEKYNKKG